MGWQERVTNIPQEYLVVKNRRLYEHRQRFRFIPKMYIFLKKNFNHLRETFFFKTLKRAMEPVPEKRGKLSPSDAVPRAELRNFKDPTAATNLVMPSTRSVTIRSAAPRSLGGVAAGASTSSNHLVPSVVAVSFLFAVARRVVARIDD